MYMVYLGMLVHYFKFLGKVVDKTLWSLMEILVTDINHFDSSGLVLILEETEKLCG